MGIRNCIECGKLCMENPSKLCPECYAQEEVYEQTIGEYLRTTGKATIEQIHKDTGVKEKIITRMMRSGRLYSEGMIGYPCEMCRAPIYDGKLCSNCISDLSKEVRRSNENWASQPSNERQHDGMRMYTNMNHKK